METDTTVRTGLLVAGGIGLLMCASLATAAQEGPCVLVLGSGSSVVDATGSAKITAIQCKLAVTSTTNPAIAATGSARVSATEICAPGGSKKTGSAVITPAPNTGCTPPADPFASVTKPTVGACMFTNMNIGGPGSRTLTPGVYCGGLSIGGNLKVTLSPGIYIVTGGGLELGGSAQVTGTGVSFYFPSGSEGFSAGGSSKLNLTAPSAGTLAGFVLYQDGTPGTPSSTAGGSAQLTLNGITYLPAQKLVFSGSAQNLSAPLSTFVVGGVKVQGSAHLRASGAIPVPVVDTVPPVIAPHEDISIETTDAGGAAVSYTAPAALDDVDGPVSVECLPASGSVFAIGTTTVTCSAEDAAGNSAVSTFAIGVALQGPEEPVLVTLASQPDESVLCTPNWRDCYTGGEPQVAIPLGSGAQFAGMLLEKATIAKQDDISGTGEFVVEPWIISILCYTDALYTTPCSGGSATSQTNMSLDNIHWSAPFNFTFDPLHYYQLVINDNAWAISAYGSATEPFWELTGTLE